MMLGCALDHMDSYGIVLAIWVSALIIIRTSVKSQYQRETLEFRIRDLPSPEGRGRVGPISRVAGGNLNSCKYQREERKKQIL